MLYSLLAQTADKYREVDLPEAALYALLGFSIVFLGISFLILIVWLVGKCMGKANGRKVSPKPVPKEEATPVAATPKADAEEISEETVAILTAAIMAYYEQNKPKCEFTVKRIKRI